MNRHQDLTNPNSLRSKLRKKRVIHLNNFVKSIVSIENISTIKICDIGGTYRYWLNFPFEEYNRLDFEITLLNLEKTINSERENYKHLINRSNVKFFEEVGNGCDLSHKEDNTYHLCHSNSVIEHVGNWSNIKAFASESLRIGKYHFIQTPNYWFPVEPHYFLPLVHFFPRPIHTRLIMRFKKRDFNRATSNFEENRMLSKREFNYLYGESRIISEKYFFFKKSFIATSDVKKSFQ